ncbi:hypothetical protein BV25DRAFT_1838823 [Artomyces pyxidatus]|uniref:Uncharacterized protein n=1 Tax=Artomyces pyxidatus TaxID=48021 RepID=A0ACB8SYH2_9AGAM|nr:hypothetical protein BV25DRAFT_1838823 [Artomyces pyxidatus]
MDAAPTPPPKHPKTQPRRQTRTTQEAGASTQRKKPQSQKAHVSESTDYKPDQKHGAAGKKDTLTYTKGSEQKRRRGAKRKSGPSAQINANPPSPTTSDGSTRTNATTPQSTLAPPAHASSTGIQSKGTTAKTDMSTQHTRLTHNNISRPLNHHHPKMQSCRQQHATSSPKVSNNYPIPTRSTPTRTSTHELQPPTTIPTATPNPINNVMHTHTSTTKTKTNQAKTKRKNRTFRSTTRNSAQNPPRTKTKHQSAQSPHKHKGAANVIKKTNRSKSNKSDPNRKQ